MGTNPDRGRASLIISYYISLNDLTEVFFSFSAQMNCLWIGDGDVISEGIDAFENISEHTHE